MEDMILGGFAESFTAGSALEAELQALTRGLDMAKGLGNVIWIEIDAQEVVNMVENERRRAAQIRHLTTGIRNKLRGCTFKISHIRREGNKVAEFLAKQGGSHSNRTTFNHDTAPLMVKALARMDRLGIPNVRGGEDEDEE
ncbi:hypothetical protein SASPL_120797 [Salvia splendens]|uniref:RNase H type-1 domain-containing protein n=1 Tax=Salvia splendens TaxID=180675 RepID=A0A8X8XV93_SALSN|nr:hypothetical protein SASPL_120797 [Salvia splendens]